MFRTTYCHRAERKSGSSTAVMERTVDFTRPRARNEINRSEDCRADLPEQEEADEN
jgi:hypothetical protein